MVQIDYRIMQNLPDSLKQEIAAQPNLINVESNGTQSLFSFDHTPAQSTTFKKWLNTKLGLYNDALSKYTTYNGGALIFSVYNKVVLTNIGTTFKNVYTDSDGMSFGIETDVYDTIRLYGHWLRGASDTGTHSLQVVDKNTPANVIATIPTLVNGPNITAWVDIPTALQNTTNAYVIQVKSTVASDDPTFIGLWIYMK